MWRLTKPAARSTLILAVALCFCPVLRAACHVVTPAGSGSLTGADWNNAYAGLPATLTAGDTYYLADGTYAAYVVTSSGSLGSVITIKKAIGPDHCTDTGWNLSTMGSGQAVFKGGTYGTGVALRSDHVVLDGQVGAGEGGTPYGFKIDDSNNATECGSGGATFCRDLPIGDTSAVTDITVDYLEIAGSCTDINLATDPQACDTRDDATEEEEVYIANTSSSISFRNDWFHSAAGGIFQFVGASNISIEDSFVGPDNSTPTEHDNCFGSNAATANVTIAFNSMHDCEGTSVIVSLNSGTTYTDDSWSIYGNWVWYSANNANNRRGVGDGFFGCINGDNCTNISIYNNTLADMTGPITKPRDNNPTKVGGNIGIVYINASTGSATVEDNLWYNNALNINFAPPRTWAEDRNSSLDPAGQSSLSGSGDVTVSGAPDPFKDDAIGNFELTGDSGSDADVANGATTPDSTDPDGVTRGSDGTWDRGAFQISGTKPNPPQALIVTSVQ